MSGFNLLSLILPPEEKVFYELFEKNSGVCYDSAMMLAKIIKENGAKQLILQVKELRQKCNAISRETLDQLNKTFITPIDREDIQYISSRLNRINKKITKTALNYKIYDLEKYDKKIKAHVSLLIDATSELRTTLNGLKKVSNVREMIESGQKIKEIENRGDELFLRDLEELFSGKFDALTVIKLKDIYNSIESALNTCSDISDEVLKIVLKNS